MKRQHLFEIAALIGLGCVQSALAVGMTCSFSSPQPTVATSGAQTIEVDSFTLRTSASSEPATGSGSDAGQPGAVLTLKTIQSEAGDQLIALGVTGTVFDTVTCRIPSSPTFGAPTASYLTAVLSNVALGEFSVASTARDKDVAPKETLTFNYGAIKWTYTQQK